MEDDEESLDPSENQDIDQYFIDQSLIDYFYKQHAHFRRKNHNWAFVLGYEDKYGIHATELWIPDYDVPSSGQAGLLDDTIIRYKPFHLPTILRNSETFKEHKENAKIIGWCHSHDKNVSDVIVHSGSN